MGVCTCVRACVCMHVCVHVVPTAMAALARGNHSAGCLRWGGLRLKKRQFWWQQRSGWLVEDGWYPAAELSLPGHPSKQPAALCLQGAPLGFLHHAVTRMLSWGETKHSAGKGLSGVTEGAGGCGEEGPWAQRVLVRGGCADLRAQLPGCGTCPLSDGKGSFPGGKPKQNPRADLPCPGTRCQLSPSIARCRDMAPDNL